MSTRGIGPDQWQAAWALVQACSPLPPERWREHMESVGADGQAAEEALSILVESASLDAESPLPDAIGDYRILKKIAAMFELARTCDGLRRFHDAQKLYASVATVRERLFGAENPSTLEAQLGEAGI